MGKVSIVPIPFLASEDKNASELGGAAPTIANVVADAAGVIRRRPGISAWTPFESSFASGSAVIGMHPFGSGRLVFVTADRRIHVVTTAGGLSELSDDSYLGSTLDGGGRPTMVAGQTMLAIAAGGAIQKWTGNGLSERLLNTGTGGDPPNAGSICALAMRLVAQIIGPYGQFWWSGPLDEWEDWDMTTGGASYIRAAAKPDELVAIRDNTNEVYAFGPETVQVFTPAALQVDANDPNNLLDFAPTRTLAVGTISPYSIIQVDDLFAFLDRRRRFVISDARSMTVISKPMAATLSTLTRTDDAWGFRLRFGRHDCLVWFFPTDNLGLIWDAEANSWSEWREGNVGTDEVSITSAYNWEEEGVFLVGLSDGSIAQLDATVSTDLTKDIAVDLVSGFVPRGTSKKACRGVVFQFKRTWEDLPAPTNGLTTSGHVRISHRDNQGAWKILKDVSLSSDPNPCISIRSIGTYRTRQWRVQYTGRDELQLVSAEEELEILEA